MVEMSTLVQNGQIWPHSCIKTAFALPFIKEVANKERCSDVDIFVPTFAHLPFPGCYNKGCLIAVFKDCFKFMLKHGELGDVNMLLEFMIAPPRNVKAKKFMTHMLSLILTFMFMLLYMAVAPANNWDNPKNSQIASFFE